MSDGRVNASLPFCIATMRCEERFEDAKKTMLDAPPEEEEDWRLVGEEGDVCCAAALAAAEDDV